jgi:hypothetical protein
MRRVTVRGAEAKSTDRVFRSLGITTLDGNGY